MSPAEKASVQGFSIESVPQDALRIDDFRTHLPEGTRVYIAWPPKATPDVIVDAAVKLNRQGMVPVPHVVARRVESEAVLERFINELAEKAHVEQLLLLGGDPPEPVGPYADAGMLLHSGFLEAANIRTVEFAAHPEGHPVMHGNTPTEVLSAKIAAAKAAGIQAKAVSQFVLDPASIIDWHENSYSPIAGGAPLQIGVPGVVSSKRLLQMASACGIGESLGMLRKSGLRLAKTALGNANTDTLVRALSPLVNRAADVSGFHFYSFGNFEKTAAWARAAAAH